MTVTVLDCSVALAWALPDETSERADRLLGRVPRHPAFWVPALWWYELANGLMMAQRRRRLTEINRIRLLETFGRLPIETDTFLNADTIARLHALGQAHSLSAYDAAYLELAQRRGLALATFDERLIAASRHAGVTLVQL